MTMVSVRNFRSYGADIYGWTGSKETPCTKKICVWRPFPPFLFRHCKKKRGTRDPWKANVLRSWLSFFCFVFFFGEMAQRGRQIQILIQSNHRNLIEECSQPGLNHFFSRFFFFKSQDLDIKMSPFFFLLVKFYT